MASYYGNIREEELRIRVGEDWFNAFDAASKLGNIDFAVAEPVTGDDLIRDFRVFYLWAEAKQGVGYNIIESFIQLILTIGKERSMEKYLPPMFLGAFDAEKIAFLPYNKIMDIFIQNDFNWKVTPSDHSSKEFKQLYERLSNELQNEIILFYFDRDGNELRRFIKQNFKNLATDVRKAKVTINNFVHVYNKWRQEVMPTINVDWNKIKKLNLYDSNFFLADLMSMNNATILTKLGVLLQGDYYKCIRGKDVMGMMYSDITFGDGQKAHKAFWNRYERPPKKEYWQKIIDRKDLLVPQEIREIKGSFYTPQKWVQLSQEYLAKELGEDWQEKYYIWDVCGGTGNMEVGLTNKYNVYVSTLDSSDVGVIMQHIATGGANLLENHVFQFDFLNDSFDLDNPEESKLPDSLIDILKDPKKRCKLVIYINPPYAEAGTIKQLSGTGKNKTNVAVSTKVYAEYQKSMGIAGRELFAQFIMRIYKEIPSCRLGIFSKLKNLQAPNFKLFRQTVAASPESIFLVPSSTFDNVKGNFPISFSIWDLGKKKIFKQITADVYDKKGFLLGEKNIYSYDDCKGNIGSWVLANKDDKGLRIGFMSNGRNDFQNQKLVYIMNTKEQMPTPRGWWITPKNLIVMSIFLAVRHCIPATWLNDRDQFLYPSDRWKTDKLFQSDCLVYTLFNNNIQSKYGTNNWIPFTEEEVDARDRFESHFMSDYIRGVRKIETKPDGKPKDSEYTEGSLAFAAEEIYHAAKAVPLHNANNTIEFSPEAKAVMDAGRELWRYYQQQPDANVNAALYDIKLYFQGTNDKGKMNTASTDEHYNLLIDNLRHCLRTLAERIEPKVYEYGFLLK